MNWNENIHWRKKIKESKFQYLLLLKSGCAFNFTNLQLCFPSFFLGYKLLTDYISFMISNRIRVFSLSYLYCCCYDYCNFVRVSLVYPKDFQFSSVQFSSVAQQCLTLCDPWTTARRASLTIINSRSPPNPMSIELVMASSHLILCHPLLLPSISPSIRVFLNESALCIRWPKYWSFNISSSNEQPGLISFRMDWLDLLNPRDSQESSPTPQFKSINSLALSFLYSPTLTSMYDHWKNHRLD